MNTALSLHPGWKLLVQAAKRDKTDALIDDVVTMAEDKQAHVLALLGQTRETLTESRKSVRAAIERAEAAEMRLARVQSYRDTCAILDQEPSIVGLELALREDDNGPLHRAHNHAPYRPPCNERKVKGIVRGACLLDDGRDAE